MRRRFLSIAAMVLLAAALHAAISTFPGAAAGGTSLKVMSFNIRYGAADDGENSWPQRRQLVIETIRNFDPDLLGMQEVLDFQADFLREQLPAYSFHGVGRDDGKTKGEFSPIMYRTERFEVIRAGHFWLSETPDVPGSKSWDSSLPRMVSWVWLTDRRTGKQMAYGNTHFDHRGPQARLESAKLIRARSAGIEDTYPVLITGDFNTSEDSEPYRVLLEGGGISAKRWTDSYRAIHPVQSPAENTFGAWKGAREGSRIDFILHSEEFLTLNGMIDYTNEAGRNPSDHYPVEAILRIR